MSQNLFIKRGSRSEIITSSNSCSVNTLSINKRVHTAAVISLVQERRAVSCLFISSGAASTSEVEFVMAPAWKCVGE